MRRCVGLVALVSSVASADGVAIHVRHLEDAQTEPLLHLDAITLDPTVGTGGLVGRRGVALDLGDRFRFGADGTWWQSGLSPSMFASDLLDHGWRAAAELDWNLGPFRIGIGGSVTRDGETTRRSIGLFAYRTLRLSRWMHAWIALGITVEQDGTQPQNVTLGLSIGSTFR